MQYIRSLKNFAAEQPYQHAVYYLAVLLTEHSWTKEELLAATKCKSISCKYFQKTHSNPILDLTLDRLQAFIPQLLSKMHIECLVHGNIDQSKALTLMEVVENRLAENINVLPLLSSQLLLNRELQLEDGCNYVYEVKNDVHKSSCVELFYQCGTQTTEGNMLLELFAKIVHEPCFDILRTKVCF